MVPTTVNGTKSDRPGREAKVKAGRARLARREGNQWTTCPARGCTITKRWGARPALYRPCHARRDPASGARGLFGRSTAESVPVHRAKRRREAPVSPAPRAKAQRPSLTCALRSLAPTAPPNRQKNVQSIRSVPCPRATSRNSIRARGGRRTSGASVDHDLILVQVTGVVGLTMGAFACACILRSLTWLSWGRHAIACIAAVLMSCAVGSEDFAYSHCTDLVLRIVHCIRTTLQMRPE